MVQRAVIVDDHVPFRTLAARLLEAAGYEVVALCGNGRSAHLAIAGLRPDLVLLDVQLPDIDGFQLMAQLDGCLDPSTVVLVSSREAADYGPRIRRSGAAAFITKSELSAQSLADVVARA